MADWIEKVGIQKPNMHNFIRSVLIGCVGGLFVALFKVGFEWMRGLIQGGSTIVLAVIGGSLVSMLALYNRDILGPGTDLYRAEITDHYEVKPTTLPLKVLATLGTVGMGSSGGLTGPMMFMGSLIGRRFDRGEKNQIYLACGAAATIGGILSSPFGAGILVLEILDNKKSYMKYLHYTITSSLFGFLTSKLIYRDWDSVKALPFHFEPKQLLPMVIAGILATLVGIVFVYTFGMVKSRILQLPSMMSGPFIGIFLGGIIATQMPFVYGLGNEHVNFILRTAIPAALATKWIVGKLLATSLVVGFGGSGGLIMPAILLGALSGNCVNSLVHGAGFGSSLVVCGIGACLTIIANVPVAAMVLMLEWVGFSYLIPIIIGSLAGHWLGRYFFIYHQE